MRGRESNPRAFTLSLGALLFALSALPAHAQQHTIVPRIGYLTLRDGPNDREEAFIKGLRELGWVEGRNIAIEYRRANGKVEAFAALAEELVASKVDILAAVATPAVAAAKKATSTIPIVMIAVADAVGTGFIASLAKPGGNITGTTNVLPELASKRLGLIREVLPKMQRVAFLAYGPDPAHKLFVKAAEDAARNFKLGFQSAVVTSTDEVDGAFRSMVKTGVSAAIIQPLFDTLKQGPRIAGLAVKHHIPTISDGSKFAEEGGLMFYGPDVVESFRRSAAFVDKILKGRQPADLPVEQPTKFQLIINLKTAKQIGLTIPPNVLARADKVIR